MAVESQASQVAPKNEANLTQHRRLGVHPARDRWTISPFLAGHTFYCDWNCDSLDAVWLGHAALDEVAKTVSEACRNRRRGPRERANLDESAFAAQNGLRGAARAPVDLKLVLLHQVTERSVGDTENVSGSHLHTLRLRERRLQQRPFDLRNIVFH